MNFDFPYEKWTPRRARRAMFEPVLRRKPPTYVLRDRILSPVPPGWLHDSSILPSRSDNPQVRHAIDVENLGYAQPPVIHLPAQETPVWGELCLMWPSVPRLPGRCLALLIHPTDQDACFAAGLAVSMLTGDSRSNGTGLQMQNKQLGMVTPNGPLNLLGQRGARPLPYYLVILINDIGTLVLLGTAGDTTGLGMDDPLGIPTPPVMRLAWVDYSDTSAWLTPYINQYAPYEVNVLDMRIIDVPAWSAPDALAAFSDRFTRSNSASSLGNDWTALSGVFGISSSQAYQVSGGGRTIAAHATSLEDGDALWHYQVKMPSGQVECYLRLKDAANTIFLWFNNTTICLARMVAGSTRPSPPPPSASALDRPTRSTCCPSATATPCGSTA